MAPTVKDRVNGSELHVSAPMSEPTMIRIVAEGKNGERVVVMLACDQVSTLLETLALNVNRVLERITR